MRLGRAGSLASKQFVVPCHGVRKKEDAIRSLRLRHLGNDTVTCRSRVHCLTRDAKYSREKESDRTRQSSLGDQLDLQRHSSMLGPRKLNVCVLRHMVTLGAIRPIIGLIWR